MPIHVVYPKVSLELSSGRIARWLVAEGEPVRQGQVLFEIDNDKAAVEVESPADGVIRELIGSEIEVDVGDNVARIYADAEAHGDSKVTAALQAPAAEMKVPRAATMPETRESGHRAHPNPTPLARRIVKENGIVLDALHGTGPGGRIQKTDVVAKIGSAGHTQSVTIESAASPVAQSDPSHALLHTVWLRRGEGIPVILLHGFSADLNNWRGMLAGARPDWPALAIDLPAHGRSPRDVPEDLNRMAEQVEATIASEQVGPLVIAGHSFGGALAARLASRGQLDIRGLCLFAPAGLGPEINAAFVDGVLRAQRSDSLRPWLDLLAHDPATISPAFLEAVVQQRDDGGLTAAMRAFAERFLPDGTQAISIRGDLARLLSPVRVVFGRQDRILPFSGATGLPGNVGMHAVDMCGHMPHLEYPVLAMKILDEVRRSS
ncbi:pyruvate dehydrogenase E2 component (dihydrolipoamide acetyltransferase) [Pararhizobium capsulatum DSM 1112]|uniref:Pyruvate dehydrogenase E2 component (Dihydrolipoamide acetyltransferase) n=1 Tax=Pararhizobium capsulatum DSM 1112 TaxID=1121113 RepID=A0ABU0BYW4_9HYPH|nr:acetoin dehydrogenase dihydrolipoyllysine-residue acetyltransferase subunit [Pararhizobium capsulatum]MDQ0323444.1 pyruvate dehydrogenase E2 component (dihydrolipoamide acetyltransferase) [Pararhizobium capsulatum DSM 1112]